MWQRAAAFLIDLVPLAVLAAIENVAGVAEHEVVGVLNGVFFLMYFAGMNYQLGGTIGKRVMGLRVSLPQSPTVLLQLIARSLVKLICFAPLLSTVYGLIAIWREDGRSLADFVTGTIVVDAATLTAPQRLSLFGRLCATVLVLVGPWVLLILLFVCLFSVAIIDELFRSL